MRSNKTASFRHQICNIIANLPVNASLEEVATVLGRFHEVSELNDTGKKLSLDDGVTPIIVACDKGINSCLQYMANHKGLSFLWGLAEEKSSVNLGANTALHHAGMSGCVGALTLLPSLDKQCSLLELLIKENSHGDTPLMLACVYNHLNFLNKIQELLCNESLIELLETKNDSGSTALSLSMEHGKPDVLQWILNAGIEPFYEKVEQFKRKLQAMNNSWAKAPPTIRQKYKQKRDNARRCLIILQIALEKKSQEAMKSLIEAEIFEDAKQNNKCQGEVKRRKNRESSNIIRSKNSHEKMDESVTIQSS
eukprot:CAMPEP_0194193412 /NCGR_PEP_ID=MMETSP0154-20130528/74493_1 /TAXON_ID=1049557 /ORGANISM="Thalassiothrix antarctica, Strain L6-D1" /LENGTH=308 /DNA_ID=CAMNT_0038917639 /DNA_START=94 /DNA_END=1016 /DNA_ORIENTATION=-